MLHLSIITSANPVFLFPKDRARFDSAGGSSVISGQLLIAAQKDETVQMGGVSMALVGRMVKKSNGKGSKTGGRAEEAAETFLEEVKELAGSGCIEGAQSFDFAFPISAYSCPSSETSFDRVEYSLYAAVHGTSPTYKSSESGLIDATKSPQRTETGWRTSESLKVLINGMMKRASRMGNPPMHPRRLLPSSIFGPTKPSQAKQTTAHLPVSMRSAIATTSTGVQIVSALGDKGETHRLSVHKVHHVPGLGRIEINLHSDCLVLGSAFFICLIISSLEDAAAVYAITSKLVQKSTNIVSERVESDEYTLYQFDARHSSSPRHGPAVGPENAIWRGRNSMKLSRTHEQSSSEAGRTGTDRDRLTDVGEAEVGASNADDDSIETHESHSPLPPTLSAHDRTVHLQVQPRLPSPVIGGVASTISSQSPVFTEVHHTLVLSVHYTVLVNIDENHAILSDPGDKDGKKRFVESNVREFRWSHDVDVGSCSLVPDNVVVPAYEDGESSDRLHGSTTPGDSVSHNGSNEDGGGHIGRAIDPIYELLSPSSKQDPALGAHYAQPTSFTLPRTRQGQSNGHAHAGINHSHSDMAETRARLLKHRTDTKGYCSCFVLDPNLQRIMGRFNDSDQADARGANEYVLYEASRASVGQQVKLVS